MATHYIRPGKPDQNAYIERFNPEILLDGKKQNHNVRLNRLSADVRRRLQEIFGALDVDAAVSLRVTATERVWGILEGNILRLLWWDPDHQICPSMKHNT